MKQLQKHDIALTIPSPPQIVTKLLTMIAEDCCSSAELGELILNDPSLTARILKVANSPFYQFSNKIETVSHAISLLGQETIRMICVSESFLAIFPMHKRRLPHLFQQHNDHSLLTGIFLKAIVTQLALAIDPEKAFIAGLLHDIGKPILWFNFPDKVAAYEQACKTGLRGEEAERMVFGFDHVMVAGWLADEWFLDDELLNAMVNHHQQDDSDMQQPDLTALLSIANLLAKSVSLADDEITVLSHARTFLHAALPQLCLEVLLADVNRAVKPFHGNLFQGLGFRDGLVEVAAAAENEAAVTDDSVISLGDTYQEMVKKALTVFNTYNYFLGNFQLGEAFYRMLENIQLSLGMSQIFILLYNRKGRQLVVKGAPAAYRQLVGCAMAITEQEYAVFAGREQQEVWFTSGQQSAMPELATKFLHLFQAELNDPQGVFVPVQSSASLVGGFVALCRPEQQQAAMIIEFLRGYAVQLALAIKIHRLNKKMMAAERDKTVTEMAGSLAHTINQPLQTLASYIYLLEKEMKIGSSGSAHRNAYCDKMKKALEEINSGIKRFQAAREYEAADYYGREKILSI
ncbi:MAG: HDOD domain-containing protein [Deltaproteobacteria bacterium]|nr:HDOD domain-containing protein [Candidatus Anaeroferrophillus wilburensis]MBN2889853.1 HDOD domain-containing protein [Deltaproteobacteria bacterium]